MGGPSGPRLSSQFAALWNKKASGLKALAQASP
ncbi:DUF6053 domain-containing protein [Lysobacter enzymogenes]